LFATFCIIDVTSHDTARAGVALGVVNVADAHALAECAGMVFHVVEELIAPAEYRLTVCDVDDEDPACDTVPASDADSTVDPATADGTASW